MSTIATIHLTSMFAVWVACCVCGATINTVELNFATMDEIVNGDDRKPFLIKCYYPGCMHCQIFQRTWEPFVIGAGDTQKLVKFGEINCDLEYRLCRKLGVENVPTLLWSDGVKKGVYKPYMAVYGVPGLRNFMKKLATSSFLYEFEADAVANLNVSRVAYLMRYKKLNDASVERFFDEGQRRNATNFGLVRAQEKGYDLLFYGTRVASVNDFGMIANIELLPELTEENLSEMGSRFVLLVLGESDHIEHYSEVASAIWRVKNAWVRVGSPVLSKLNIDVRKRSIVGVTPEQTRVWDITVTEAEISNLMGSFGSSELPLRSSLGAFAGMLVIMGVVFWVWYYRTKKSTPDAELPLTDSENVHVDVTSPSVDVLSASDNELFQDPE